MGAVLPFAKVAKGNDAAIFVADLHSITSVKDGKTLREQTLEIAIEYLAIYGVDTPITIFRQSDIREITQLMWILTNVTPYSLMLRAHSYKDFQQEQHDLEGKLNYAKGQFDIWDQLYNDPDLRGKFFTNDETLTKYNSYSSEIFDLEKEIIDKRNQYENNLNM
jgi:tryptophanyl-tRNA synthetase